MHRDDNGNERVTLKDVALKTGYSINTVSAVLNDRKTRSRVGPKATREILKAASALGYRRNLAAAHLAGGRTKSLGILMDVITNPFAAPIAESFELETSKQGYQCLLGCTQYNGVKKLEYVNRLLEHQVEGLLLVGVWTDPEVDTALDDALSVHTQVVAVDFPWHGHDVPTVCSDHYRGGHLLGEHLVEIGHKKILYLATHRDHGFFSVENRIRGLRDAVEKYGAGKCTLEMADTEGYEADRLGEVAFRYLQSENPPTALSFTHDINAFLAMKFLASCGIEVPRDVAVTGFDDTQYELFHTFRAEGVQPVEIPITTVRQPLREIGAEAARVLIKSIERPEEVRSNVTYLDVELIVRETSRLPAWVQEEARGLEVKADRP